MDLLFLPDSRKNPGMTVMLLTFQRMNRFRSSDLSSPGKQNRSIALKDSKGRDIVLSAYPEKVISLGPNLTETVYALDRGDLLIGRTDFCNFPPAALSVPSVGTLMEPNIETIINLEPDLVLASTHVSEDTVLTLEKMGIPVALLYGPEDFSGLGDVLRGLWCAAECRKQGRGSDG